MSPLRVADGTPLTIVKNLYSATVLGTGAVGISIYQPQYNWKMTGTPRQLRKRIESKEKRMSE